MTTVHDLIARRPHIQGWSSLDNKPVRSDLTVPHIMIALALNLHKANRSWQGRSAHEFREVADGIVVILFGSRERRVRSSTEPTYAGMEVMALVAGTQSSLAMVLGGQWS